MGFLGVVLIVVFIISAILLIGLVLIQDEQGEGLGGIFGGGSATPFGSRSGNVLTRFTSILGAVFLFCSFGIAWVNRGNQSGNVIAAAARQNSSSAAEWWNAPVNSNKQLSTSNPLPPVTPSATPSAGKTAANGGASSAPGAAASSSGATSTAGGASASNPQGTPSQSAPSSAASSAGGSAAQPPSSGTAQ